MQTIMQTATSKFQRLRPSGFGGFLNVSTVGLNVETLKLWSGSLQTFFALLFLLPPAFAVAKENETAGERRQRKESLQIATSKFQGFHV